MDEERFSQEDEELQEEEEEYLEEDHDVEDEEEEGAEVEEEIAGVGKVPAAATSGADVVVDSFEELRLAPDVVVAAQEAWKTFISMAASREAAGEAIYAALFDAAPSLQSLFTTPRAIQAMRFMNGLNQFIMGLSDPPSLKVSVETLGFGHLALDVTVPRVVIFRDAILDLFQVELGSRLTTEAYTGWKAMLNYVGGAIIYTKAFYADRIRLLGESWAIANDTGSNKDKFATLGSMEKEATEKAAATTTKGKGNAKEQAHEEGSGHHERSGNNMVQNIPTTFKEMFQFNAAVMGFGTNVWMNEVLACFDNIVSNVSNSSRLVEECDVLVCRIAKVSTGKVNLAEFKSCMLASLRSLLPKDWTTQHEVAWSWLWENVEQTLMKNMGQPPIWEKAYGKLLDSIDEATGFQLRKDIYQKFFSLAPAGQDFFKQSNTYLHLIATKVLVMAIDMYRDPVRMVDDISALGLRHVGYAIPTEYMPPFASACVEVVQGLTKDQVCIDGFQWSIGLIAKSLVRTILEGSTIVMKAVNLDTQRSMTKALSVAPRGDRSSWMLMIQVGTQNISPLAWSIESGALQSASAMLKDLLTFRADRDKYYYADDDLFKRHPNLVDMLLRDAPGLLPEMLDGLTWRSRLTVGGTRRVNYYIKHLLVDPDGKFHKTLEWVARARDPKLVCHPVIALLSDQVWVGVAMFQFTYRKAWFLFSLCIFVICQAVITNLHDDDNSGAHRYMGASFRAFIYVFGLGELLYKNIAQTIKAYRKPETLTAKFVFVRVPSYLLHWQDVASLVLMFCLIGMVCTEPILHCMQNNNGVLFTEECPEAKRLKFFPYSIFSMIAMFFYYILLMDLAVFSHRVSAYVLVCGRMIAELALFLWALAVVVVTFASAVSCLDQSNKHFAGILPSILSFLELFFQVMDPEVYRQMYDTNGRVPIILIASFIFLVSAVLFLSSMLIAQLACAYDAVYTDMLGYARLKRIKIIIESMPNVTAKRWDRFVSGLQFEKRIEFNEGDVGVANGVATTEPSSAHPTTSDQIKRFGGSTSPTLQWPEDSAGDDDSDKFERLETLMKRTLDRVNKSHSKMGDRGSSSADMGKMSGSGSAGGSVAGSGSGAGVGDAESEEED